MDRDKDPHSGSGDATPALAAGSVAAGSAHAATISETGALAAGSQPHDTNQISKTLPAERVEWIDTAKGVMILLVVIGHAWRGLFGAGIMEEAQFAALDGRIYAFHMPVFFALSGWFFIASLDRTALSAFYRGRLTRLVWPMILWTYLFLGVKVLAGQYQNAPAQFSDMLILPIPGVWHMWFIWALLLMNIAFSALKPLAGNPRALQPVLWAALLAFSALHFVELGPVLGYWAGQAVSYAPFFITGLIMGSTQGWQRFSAPLTIPAVLSFGALLTFWPLLRSLDLTFWGSFGLTLSAIFIFAGIGKLGGEMLHSGFSYLGKATMPIFLAHTIFSASLREVLLVLGWTDITLHMVLGTVIGIVGPLVLLDIAKRTGTVRMLGF